MRELVFPATAMGLKERKPSLPSLTSFLATDPPPKESKSVAVLFVPPLIQAVYHLLLVASDLGFRRGARRDFPPIPELVLQV